MASCKARPKDGPTHTHRRQWTPRLSQAWAWVCLSTEAPSFARARYPNTRAASIRHSPRPLPAIACGGHHQAARYRVWRPPRREKGMLPHDAFHAGAREGGDVILFVIAWGARDLADLTDLMALSLNVSVYQSLKLSIQHTSHPHLTDLTALRIVSERIISQSNALASRPDTTRKFTAGTLGLVGIRNNLNELCLLALLLNTLRRRDRLLQIRCKLLGVMGRMKSNGQRSRHQCAQPPSHGCSCRFGQSR